MLTLYHAPLSRSSRIVQLVHDMGLDDEIEVVTVTVPRFDGSGARDPKNPHPEGKVPLLVHDGVAIRESNAIVLYLTDLFPDSGLGIPVGDPRRGLYLGWLAYYGNVVEPVHVIKMAEAESPAFTSTFRDVSAVGQRLSEALDGQDYLCGDSYTGADLMMASLYNWMPDFLPQDARIRAWYARCSDRPANKWMMERDSARAA